MAKSLWKEAILAELREARARVEALESVLHRGQSLGADVKSEKKEESK